MSTKSIFFKCSHCGSTVLSQEFESKKHSASLIALDRPHVTKHSSLENKNGGGSGSLGPEDQVLAKSGSLKHSGSQKKKIITFGGGLRCLFVSKETVYDCTAWVPSLKKMNFQMTRIIEKSSFFLGA